jgi:type I restriction enzyme, S subunit
MTTAFAFDRASLEDLPRTWTRVPLWTLIKRRDVTNRPDAELLSVYRDHGVVPKDSREDNFNKPSEDLTTYRHVRRGDLVLNKMKTWQGSLAVSDFDGIVSPAYIVCEITGHVNKRYFHHLLRSQPYIHLYQALSKGIRPNQWDLPFEDFKNISVALPPLDEQRRIADFLDAETARIDQLVRLRGQQVARMTERLALAAAEATGRLALRIADAATPLRATLRRMALNVQTGTTPQGLRDCGPNRSADEVPWYTPAAINDMLTVGEADKCLTSAETALAPNFPAGSVLIVGIGESLGKIGYLDHVATGNQQLTALTAAPGTDAKFLAWQLWSAQEDLRSWAQYSRVRIINNDVLKSFPMWLPARSKQIQAREALDAQRAHLVRFREAAALFALTMTERRQALITAAVVGKFDVTTARGADLS